MYYADSLIVANQQYRDRWLNDETVDRGENAGNFGEVFTPAWIVSDMLDTVSKRYHKSLSTPLEAFPLHKTFLEPSCGTGNFLVQILQRKFVLVHSREQVFQAVSTTYGVEIQKDNVLISRLRLLYLCEDKCKSEGIFDEDFMKVLADVLEKNIVGGDFIQDKRGVVIQGLDEVKDNFFFGGVMNSTGLVEEDAVTRAHHKLIFYEWDWHDGHPTKTAKFLHNPDAAQPKVEKVDNEDMLAKLRASFGK